MIKGQLEEIIKKEKNVIPFLKSLTSDKKKELAKDLEEIHTTVFESKWIEKKGTFGVSYETEHSHSQAQRDIVHLACFVCLNKTKARKLVNRWNLANDEYLEILEWYTPNWYNEFIQKDPPWNLTYLTAMKLSKQGKIVMTDELVRNKLTTAILENKRVNDKHISLYKPENLTQFKETLENHIWLLFEEETQINNYYNVLYIDNYKDGNDIWIHSFTTLSKEGRIDRKRLTKAVILTSTKGFNKTLSGWYYELLEKLKLSKNEAIEFQQELLSSLHSPHSKVVNQVLKIFKSIAAEKKFEASSFVDNSSILLSSETKSVVNSTLMILDKVANKHKDLTAAVCLVCAEVMLNTDEKLQLRAAKIIVKFADNNAEELCEELNMYHENMMHSVKEILGSFLTEVDTLVDSNDIVSGKMNLLSEENKVEEYKELNDIIFFVNQSLENNAEHHIDLLIAYLPILSSKIDRSNVTKLEPLFKRAFDVSMWMDWQSRTGNIEVQAALLINDFSEILMKRYPSELSNFQQFKEKKIKILEGEYHAESYKERLKNIEDQLIPDYLYQIHRSLFVKSKEIIKQNKTVQLLSTPTHLPCWIHPEGLIKRINDYATEGVQMDLFDFQIALGRVPFFNLENPKEINCNSVSDNTIRNILKYLFNQYDITNESFERPDLWIQVLLSKNILSDIEIFKEKTGNPLSFERSNYNWDCEPRNASYKSYDYQTQKEILVPYTRKKITIYDSADSSKKSESLIGSVKKFFKKHSKKEVISVYNHIKFSKGSYFINLSEHDDLKFLYLFPNTPSPYLGKVIKSILKESTFFDEQSKRNTIRILQGLHEIWQRDDLGEVTYLFLGYGILCSDKVAREVACEIWIKTISEGNIKNKELGRILGQLQHGDFSPMKRFTDLISNNLYNISKKHNQSLLELIDNMIGYMNEDPLRGTKKLLELFNEMKTKFPGYKMSELTTDKLTIWEETKSLHLIITKINK